MKIVENRAKCRLCGEEIKSNHHEDPYRFCKCGAVGVGGGQQSILRIGHHAHIVELSVKEYFESPC